MTLDGFFAGPAGELDWHRVDDEFFSFAVEQLDSVDTLVFGRVTYQMMVKHWTSEEAIKNDPIISRKMNRTDKMVFSRTLERVEWTNSRLVKDAATEEVARVKRQPGKDMIIFGSANLAATFTRGGLINEYRVMVNPVVLGSGRPLFPRIETRLAMKLLDSRVFRSGNVLLTYQPQSAAKL